VFHGAVTKRLFLFKENLQAAMFFSRSVCFFMKNVKYKKTITSQKITASITVDAS